MKGVIERRRDEKIEARQLGTTQRTSTRMIQRTEETPFAESMTTRRRNWFVDERNADLTLELR